MGRKIDRTGEEGINKFGSKMGDKGSYICDMLKEIEKELNIE